ncbi:MAG: OmpA family protein [Gemmatimonadota bacterium]|nr:OmpA family protein [Gemmatimonadota bacterium]
MHVTRPLSFAVFAFATITSVGGCASMSKQHQGAIIGAAAGGVIGGAIGRNNGSTAAGVIIGATIGGGAGAMIGHRMDRQAAELERTIPGAKVERVGEGIQVMFDSGILFDFDSDVLRSEARENLRSLAGSLHKYDGTNLYIVGHTDDIGSRDYNQSLSDRRAGSAARFLVSQGVEWARVRTDGLGEDEPVDSNATEHGRQANRRVEVAIYASEAYREEARRQFSGR